MGDTRRYFGDWNERADLVRDFDTQDVAADEEILVAEYTYEDYSGSAFVLFTRDGTLYEVHGSHCSCYGLEGQWSPEETTVAALRMRNAICHTKEAEARVAELLAAEAPHA